MPTPGVCNAKTRHQGPWWQMWLILVITLLSCYPPQSNVLLVCFVLNLSSANESKVFVFYNAQEYSFLWILSICYEQRGNDEGRIPESIKCAHSYLSSANGSEANPVIILIHSLDVLSLLVCSQQPSPNWECFPFVFDLTSPKNINIHDDQLARTFRASMGPKHSHLMFARRLSLWPQRG